MKDLFSLVAIMVMLSNNIPGSTSLAVMSVDLSSEWLKIALVKPGVPMEIILNAESRRKTPVVVSIKNGEFKFGDAALTVGTKHPQNAYFYVQDLLAKKLDSPAVQNYIKRFPYVQLEEDEERGTVYFTNGEDRYFPEELLAIALNKSRELAEQFAEQRVKDCVITVPAFFNQAERKAIMFAAELADVKVLQLINDNVAVALNYGVFRQNDFNNSVYTVMFYDMGAGSSIATIVSYQIVKTKEKGISESNPTLVVKGVGFDRTLGGLEIDLRLRDHLATKFNEAKKTKKDIYESPRAMAKLLKEANRVKKVLSANIDHVAQIENVFDDQELRVKVTRAELEEMCADLFERIGGPVDTALKASEMTMGEIDNIILVGGGTRVPKVQEKLLETTGKSELAKNINADEAAALGAVYQAAHLSKGFKVKKFIIKDANLYPIHVQFQRVSSEEDDDDISKTIRRTLFGRNNPVPQKKVITFNRHKSDFSFIVGYRNLEDVLPKEDLESFGPANLTTYTLKGVQKALNKQSDAEPKGIKAHFRLDESGLLHLDTVESVFEKTETVMEEVNNTEEEQSTLQKLGSTISRFFSGSSDNAESKVEEGQMAEDGATSQDSKEEAAENKEKPQDDKTEDDATDELPKDKASEETVSENGKDEPLDNDKQDDTEDKGINSDSDINGKTGDVEDNLDTNKNNDPDINETDTPKDSDRTDSSENTETKDEAKDSKDTDKETKSKKIKVMKPKVVTLKENLTIEAEEHGIPLPTKETRKASRNKLNELRKKEEERKAREQSLNSLESFIYDMQDKLDQEDYEKCSNEQQREKLRGKLSEASDWLYEVEDGALHTVFDSKLKELQKSSKNLLFRVRELRERPQLIGDLKQLLNVSQMFMAAAKNVTHTDVPIFTEIEIGLLEKVYNETMVWYSEQSKAQSEASLTEKPILLTEELKEKIIAIDRELRYLVNKAKAGPPKKKTTKPKKKKNETETLGDKPKTNETKPTDDTAEELNVKMDKANIPETIPDEETIEETLQLPASKEDVEDRTEDVKETKDEATEPLPEVPTMEPETNTETSRSSGDL